MLFKIAHGHYCVQKYTFPLKYARNRQEKVRETVKIQKSSINICVIQKIVVPLHPLKKKHRGVEQLVARQAHNLEVARSNPASATK